MKDLKAGEPLKPGSTRASVFLDALSGTLLQINMEVERSLL